MCLVAVKSLLIRNQYKHFPVWKTAESDVNLKKNLVIEL